MVKMYTMQRFLINEKLVKQGIYSFDEILEKSVRNGVYYMQKKDFQINDLLENLDNLKNITEEL